MQELKTVYEIGYEMNAENYTPIIGGACGEQFLFNV